MNAIKRQVLEAFLQNLMVHTKKADQIVVLVQVNPQIWERKVLLMLEKDAVAVPAGATGRAWFGLKTALAKLAIRFNYADYKDLLVPILFALLVALMALYLLLVTPLFWA